MLVGYVSDERFVALAGVEIEFERDGETVATTRSTARGKVLADLAPGPYTVTLNGAGFGPKIVEMTVDPAVPYQFRLLSDCLLGYVWPKWVRTGERSEFRVHSHKPYRLTLWRYGRHKEMLKILGWFDEHGPNAVVQVTPDGDYTQTGVRWNSVGYRSAHHTQFVTGPERSGLYYLEAESEDGEEFFSFPWIVAPATPSAPIAVIASTNDWNAYNNFGGRSNYVNSTGLPATPIVNARQELPRYKDTFSEWAAPDEDYLPLSFERPELGNTIPRETEVTDPIRGRLTCGQAPAEWRLVGWLEEQGFAYDYYAEHHLHTGALDLDAYRVLIISVHPEYWSREMYLRVKTWVKERGGRLMYLGGNGLNAEIVFLDDATIQVKTSLPSPNGTLGWYDEARGEYIDSRFHRTFESEANLTGVVTTDAGIMTSAPYKVIKDDHWVYTGTGLRAGDLFGEKSLHERVHGGASGHETDKMSASSPKETVLLAKGTNVEDGGAEMVCIEYANGGKVFSVGSITWVASLFPDEHVSRITSNVITRFLQD
jgi:N,N-dimethylformamidase